MPCRAHPCILLGRAQVNVLVCWRCPLGPVGAQVLRSTQHAASGQTHKRCYRASHCRCCMRPLLFRDTGPPSCIAACCLHRHHQLHAAALEVNVLTRLAAHPQILVVRSSGSHDALLILGDALQQAPACAAA